MRPRVVKRGVEDFATIEDGMEFTFCLLETDLRGEQAPLLCKKIWLFI